MIEQFTFFWNEADGPKQCFNQWYRKPFIHKNFKFKSAEQAMMAEKALLFHDIGTLHDILESGTPAAAKALGRLVQNFDQSVWDRCKLSIVYQINISKFSQDPIALKNLLDTAGTTLVEASPVDKVWGIGLSESDPKALDRATWEGENLLGRVLMLTRETLSK